MAAAWPLDMIRRSRSGHVGRSGSIRSTPPYRTARMSAIDRQEPMWEVLAWLIIRRECARSFRARSRSSTSVAGLVAANTSGNPSKSYVGVELHSLELQAAHADHVHEGLRLPRPERIVELVEGQDGALRHAGDEVFEGGSCGFVKIEVEEQKADDDVGMVGDEGGDRLRRVPLDQLDLADVAEEAVLVVELDQALQFCVGVRMQGAGLGGRPGWTGA